MVGKTYFFYVLFKKNYKKPTGWGAGQPGFPCKDGVVGET